MKHTTALRHALTRAANKRNSRNAKNMYLHPITYTKQKPLQSIGILTLGAGLLSGFYLYLKSKGLY